MENLNALLLTAYEKFGSVGIDEFIDCFIDENLDEDEIDVAAYNEFLSEHYPDRQYFSMDLFDEVASNMKPWEVVRSCYYGDFKPCDEYFYFNGYANFASCDEWVIKREASQDTEFLKWYINENNLIDEDEANAIIKEANKLIRMGY